MSYMVSVQGGSAPSALHETLESAKAEAEAERLAEQPRNRHAIIHVVQIIDVLEPRNTHEWEGGAR